ncbi:hypothetical protein N7U66_17395 [Lacinutrix neustonica]|uniref:Trypsin-like peptidase domain-containing protein n=1 Tax=Lacinutrix neustonica TaxID=2980107 RepID=A0A9E8MUC0_9FLAO|nr:hypothetical protein [Lacinutrix neustonica]WAC01678.1 hypothetical protein N7U66_17395 [Lacinutrix neustonica]
MILENDDKLISKVTVRLKRTDNNTVIGTGILYYQDSLKDKIYIFTTAHSLFNDSDEFKEKLDSIDIDVFNDNSNRYETITVNNIDERLISKDKDSDFAIIIIEKELIENLVGEIPKIKVAKERLDFSKFVCKGFPMATMGKELDVIYPIWKQRMTEVDKFQLELTETYTEFNMKGFSRWWNFYGCK